MNAIELFDPMSPSTLKEPYRAYQALRDHCPVAFLEPLDIWVLSRYSEVRSVLAAPEAFSAALAFGRDAPITDSRCTPPRQLNLKFAGDSGGVVSSTDGATHARLRRMVATILSKPRLNAAEEAIGDHVRRVIAGLAAERREFDVVADLAKPVAAKAIGNLMGHSDDVARVLASWVDLTARALDPGDEFSVPSARARVMHANLSCVRAVTRFLDANVGEAPTGTGGVLVEDWRRAETPTAREEVILSALQLFQAGYETIVSAICYILAAFVIDQPGSALSAAASDGFTSLVDEGLRLASPVRATFRTAVGRQVVDGVSLPDHAMIMVLLGSANRDERIFERPAEMRRERPTGHMAFGAGPHRCLGRFLAHMELKHVLGTLRSTTTSMVASGGARISANILKASYNSLPVRVEWRSPSSPVR